MRRWQFVCKCHSENRYIYRLGCVTGFIYSKETMKNCCVRWFKPKIKDILSFTEFGRFIVELALSKTYLYSKICKFYSATCAGDNFYKNITSKIVVFIGYDALLASFILRKPWENAQYSSIQLNTAQYSSMQFHFFGNIKHLKSSIQINAHSNFPWFPLNKCRRTLQNRTCKSVNASMFWTVRALRWILKILRNSMYL